MADSTGSNVVAWFSIATPTGLSIASIGTPGLKDDVEDQVLTGGLTAIQQILGSEIGASDDRFLGGSPSSRMGRFRLKHGPEEEQKEIIAQFLMVSATGETIPEPMINMAEAVCTDFSMKIVSNKELMAEVEQNFMTLNILSTLDIFVDSVTEAKKRVKVSSNDRVFDQEIRALIVSALEDHEFSPTLETITEKPKGYQETIQFIQTNSKDFIEELKREILALLCYKNPYSLLIKSKPSDAHKRTRKIFEESTREIIDRTGDILVYVLDEVKEHDILTIIREFSITELADKKSKIRELVEDHVMKRLSKKWPLLLLINPELEHGFTSFNARIGSFVDAIFAEYDLGTVLGNIAEIMVGEKEDQFAVEKIGEYIKNFTMNFPTGISNHAWTYMRLLLHLIESKTGKTLEKALKSIELTGIHETTIDKKLKTIKIPKKLKPLRLASTDDNIANFYTAVGDSLSIAFQQLFNALVWDYNEQKVGGMVENFASYLQDFVFEAQKGYSLLQTINVVQKSRLPTDGRDMPQLKDLIEIRDKDSSRLEEVKKNFLEITSYWEPETIVKAITKNIPRKEEADYQDYIKYNNNIEKEMNSIQKQFTSFTQRSISDMAQGFDIFTLGEQELDPKNSFADYVAVCKMGLDNYKSKIQEMAQEIQAQAIIAREEKKKEKDLKKVLKACNKEAERIISPLAKTNVEVLKRITDLRKKRSKTLSKDADRANKDLRKLYPTFAYPAVKVKVTKDRKITSRDYYKIFPRIIKEITRKIDYDRKFPRNKYLISSMLSLHMFGKLPDYVRKRGLELAIFDPRSSDVLSMLLQEGSSGYRSGRSINIDERLKELVEEVSRKKTLITILTMIEMLKEAYLINPVKLSVYDGKNKKTIIAVNLGRFIEGVDPSWLSSDPTLFGNKLQVQFINKIPHLMLVLGKKPKTKKKLDETGLYVSQFLGKRAWEDSMKRHELYMELLRYSAAVLGKNKEKKLTDFIDQIRNMIPF
ncbi:MAG: hypothetical protein ACXAEU_20080 [Candidatus Hodarchaeales archaeon]